MQIIEAVDIVRIAQAADTNKEWFAKFAIDGSGFRGGMFHNASIMMKK